MMILTINSSKSQVAEEEVINGQRSNTTPKERQKGASSAKAKRTKPNTASTRSGTARI